MTDSLYYVLADHLGSWEKVMDENKNTVLPNSGSAAFGKNNTVPVNFSYALGDRNTVGQYAVGSFTTGVLNTVSGGNETLTFKIIKRN